MRAETSYEKSFKKLILGWAEEQGIDLKYLKFTVPGQKGWPDRLILWGPEFRMLFIEWKRPGQRPEPLQEEIHRQLRAMGAEVQVHDNCRLALEEVTHYISSKARTDTWYGFDRGEQRDTLVSPPRKGQDSDCAEVLLRFEEAEHGRLSSGSRSSTRRHD